MATSKPRIFTKERIANIMAAVVIMWGFVYFTNVYTTSTSDGSGSEVIAGIMGFAAKHLWDVCRE